MQRSPAFSKTIKTEVVCPNDTNPMGILQGGRLVQWMDIAAAVCAQTQAGRICVTASIDTVSFNKPAYVGDIVTIEAKITRVFTTSMEVIVQAWARNVSSAKNQLISKSYFTFVALDENAKASLVPDVKPITAEEKKNFKEAMERRKAR